MIEKRCPNGPVKFDFQVLIGSDKTINEGPDPHWNHLNFFPRSDWFSDMFWTMLDITILTVCMTEKKTLGIFKVHCLMNQSDWWNILLSPYDRYVFPNWPVTGQPWGSSLVSTYNLLCLLLLHREQFIDQLFYFDFDVAKKYCSALRLSIFWCRTKNMWYTWLILTFKS